MLPARGMGRRRKGSRMTRPTYEQLLDLLAQKDRQIAELEAQVKSLATQLQEALRASKRQAAPFSKGPPKPDPKPPGRKSGDNYGTVAFRKPLAEIQKQSAAEVSRHDPEDGT